MHVIHHKHHTVFYTIYFYFYIFLLTKDLHSIKKIMLHYGKLESLQAIISSELCLCKTTS